jgi:hypothetical protein
VSFRMKYNIILSYILLNNRRQLSHKHIRGCLFLLYGVYLLNMYTWGSHHFYRTLFELYINQILNKCYTNLLEQIY